MTPREEEEKEATTYSACCPVCGYEHDFSTERELDTMWKRWMGRREEWARPQMRARRKRESA